VRCLEGSAPWKGSFWHWVLSSQHIIRVWGTFGLFDIISSPHPFQVVGFLIFRSICSAWKYVASLVRWHWEDIWDGWDLTYRPICSCTEYNACIAEPPCLCACKLSGKGMVGILLANRFGIVESTMPPLQTPHASRHTS